MAFVNLKDVRVYATFSRGFRVVEESTGHNGKQYSARWTVWLETANVAEGDVVSVSGFLSAKVNEWTDKDGAARHSVELALNSPRIDGRSDARPVEETPPQDVVSAQWASGAFEHDDGMPF